MKLLMENWRKFINEEMVEPISTLRIFDFDETIAHTQSETRIEAPDKSLTSLSGQKEFDAYMKQAAENEGIDSFDPVEDLIKMVRVTLMVRDPPDFSLTGIPPSA